MSLAPTASIVLGNLRYDLHAAQVTATLAALPAVGAGTVTLPAGVELTAAPGDPATLTLDGGEGGETVLTGTVRAIRRGILATEVTIADTAAGMALLRPQTTFERQAAADVIRRLASAAGVTVGGVEADLPLAAYAAHQGRTAAEHVAHLATLAGATAVIDAAGKLDVRTDPTEPDVALRFGREILDYAVHDRPSPTARPIVVGFGPAGSPDAPGALRHTTTALPADAPAAGADAVWVPAPLLRTPGAARTATEGAAARAAERAQRARAVCFLLPGLRPGNVVQVQDVTGGLSGGPWRVTRVVHRLRPSAGGTTVFEGVAAGAGAGSLLGALLSAAGGLL